MPGDRYARLELGSILRMDLGAACEGDLDALGRRHRREFVGIRPAEKIGAEQYAPAAKIITGTRIGNLPDRQVGVGDSAENMLVLFPEASPELQSDLDRAGIGNRVDCHLHRAGNVDGDLAQHGQRQGADAPVGLRLLHASSRREVLVRDDDAALVLLDRGRLGAVANDIRQLAGEGLADPAHAADRLEHRRLKVVIEKILQAAPQARGENVMERHRLAIDRLGAKAAAWVLRVTAEIRGFVARSVAKILVEAAMGAQRLEQNLLIFFRHIIVERALPRRLGQELGDSALEISPDLADALRPAAKGLGVMQKGVVVELNEGLERDAELATIVQKRVVMVRDAPGPWIEVEAVVEVAALGRAAELRVDIAAAKRPVPTAGAGIIFKDLNLVSGAAEFVGSGHPGKASAQYDDGGAFWIAFERDRPAIGRLGRKAETGHRLVRGRRAGGRADQCEETAPADGRPRPIDHDDENPRLTGSARQQS